MRCMGGRGIRSLNEYLFPLTFPRVPRGPLPLPRGEENF